MRLASPDSACVGLDVQTEHGRSTYNGRIFDVDNPRHIRMLRDQGAFPTNLGGTPRTGGFPCGCGFRSLFVRCSRCGTDNPRTEE